MQTRTKNLIAVMALAVGGSLLVAVTSCAQPEPTERQTAPNPVASQQAKPGVPTLVGKQGRVKIIDEHGEVEEVDTDDLVLQGVQRKQPSSKPQTQPDTAGKEEVAEEGEGEGEGEPLTEPKPPKLMEQPETGEPKTEPAVGEAGEPAPAKPLTDDQKAAKAKQKTEDEATRRADVENIQRIRKTGGAYFYDKEGKPLSNEELDKRLETGEVAGIRAVDLQQQPWAAKSKPKEGEKSEPEEESE